MQYLLVCVYAGRRNFSLVGMHLELQIFIGPQVLGVGINIIELVDAVDDDRCCVLGWIFGLPRWCAG